MTSAIEKIKEVWKACSFQNLKNNWYFIISAIAFFCLNIKAAKATVAVAVFVALFASCIIAAYFKSILDYVKTNRKLTVFSIISSIGINIGIMDSFTFQCFYSNKIISWLFRNSYFFPLFNIGRIICCIASIFFVCVFVIIFWQTVIISIQRDKSMLFLPKAEIAIYSVLFLLSCAYVIYSFSNSKVFYNTHEYGYVIDVIYTSDSPAQFQPCTYLWPVHEQNDLRQPLFALFAAPFIGVPYLLSYPFSTSVRAIAIDCVQVAILFIANIFIAKSMKIKPLYRICFMILSFCTYSNLLFSIMMEQYIISYFWLSIVVYMICSSGNTEDFNMLAAGGSLLPSFIMLLFVPALNSYKSIKLWYQRTLMIILEFLALLCVFCKFDIILTVFSAIKDLTRFTGKDIPFTTRLMQFSQFVSGCFVAPDANVNFSIYNHAVWALNAVTTFSVLGAVIVCLALLSAAINRKNTASKIAGMWVLLSIVILSIIGWGTEENGLIIYALYFSWAYLVLLFQLLAGASEKLKINFSVPIISALSCIAMLICNIPAIRNMLMFAFQYYPA